ncbi:hypothetical protein GWI33_002134, partial [Rhynchophorus ferrugineus]
MDDKVKEKAEENEYRITRNYEWAKLIAAGVVGKI